MQIGTKSVLFGGHQFLIHTIAIAWAWKRLYGFPWDPRLWVAFVVHDLGYIGKPNMDEVEGESHPEFGAEVMRRLFGDVWGDFTLYHSRFYAKNKGAEVSTLCVADKLATVITPRWLYLPLIRLSGEIDEYRTATKYGHRYSSKINQAKDDKEWHLALKSYMMEHVERLRPIALDIATLSKIRAEMENPPENSRRLP